MCDDIFAARGSLRAAMSRPDVSQEPRMLEAVSNPEIARTRTVSQIKRALVEANIGFVLTGTPRSYQEADARALASE